MLSIIANPQDNSPINTRLFDTKNLFTTKMLNTGGRTSFNVTQAGGYAFGTQMMTIGSTVINTGLFILENPDTFYTTALGTQTFLTTYDGNVPLMRVGTLVEAKSGQTIESITLQNLNFNLVGAGVTGTFRAKLCKMSSDGTITTVATATKVISAVVTDISLFASATSVALAAGDRIVVEMDILLTSGTHSTTNYVSVEFSSFVLKGLFIIS